MTGFCRDCLTDAAPGRTRCIACGSPRLIRHKELASLSIAHVDCDAFYATIEKRDNPAIADKPVVVGGGKRGVVAAACYIARTYGVRSAMPMFKAFDACPHLVVIKPNIAKYAAVGREVRTMMRSLTPLVEPLSIDEAFMDLTGTERLHGMSPAKTLARFAIEVEKKHGITVSIGLAPNKFLAKTASDIDKPRGFAVLSQSDAITFLAPKPVGFIYGVGHVSAQRLTNDGYRLIGDLQRADEHDLMRRYGEEGLRLARLAKGIDTRPVEAERETKSISAETTFNEDISEFRPLERTLWELTEKVSDRLKASGLAGTTITLKLKSADFKNKTRSRSVDHPTQLASRIFAAGRDLLTHEISGTKYRLIGIGVSNLSETDGDDMADMLGRRSAEAEHAIDRLRKKFGQNAVVKGLSLDDE